MMIAELFNGTVQCVYESETIPVLAPPFAAIDVSGFDPCPDSGWVFDGEMFHPPQSPVPTPTDQRPVLVIDSITASPETGVMISGVSEITCPAGTTFTAVARLTDGNGATLPVDAVFRMPVVARDGQEIVAMASFTAGVATISIPFGISGVWMVTEATINSTLPPEQQMRFAGITVYVVV